MIRRLVLLAGMGVMSMAAAPQSWFNTSPTVPPAVTVRPVPLPSQATPPGFEPAPTPNRDAYGPVTRASRDTSVSAGIFTRSDQYRGSALLPSDSAQVEQDRRVTPGAGINLSMPLQ
jgi:hypothetical protein